MNDNDILHPIDPLARQFRQVDAGVDAFGRVRCGLPLTLHDSKLSTAAHPLFWSDVEASGGGTSSTYSKAASRYLMAVSATTAGKRIRQSKQRMNYQPGKSQLMAVTFVLGESATGITRRVGYFDDNDGFFLEQTSAGLFLVLRSSVSGSPVDTRVAQTNWWYDTLDGSGPSQITIDETKAQIFFIDFESLQVGTIRYGFYFDGIPVYAHTIHNANFITVPYFSTPNLPVRYEISNDGTGGAATMSAFCSTVISEGGSPETGITRWASTGGVHVDANAADTLYAIVGLRLKSTALDSVVKIKSVSVISETSDNFEWILMLNPTVAGTFTYADVSNSAVQRALGATANTVTGGTALAGGFSLSSAVVAQIIESLYYMGATVANTPDEIVLCVRPLSSNSDIQGGINFVEIA